MGFADIAKKALKEVEGSQTLPASFDPDGLLREVFHAAIEEGWSDERLMEFIDTLRMDGALKAPWGFRVKDSPFIDELWFVSDETAKGMLPSMAKGFTVDELRPIVEAFRVFPGSQIVKVQI
ncbi:MAG: hypothetical protein HZB84_02695 [Deltaproteobacteria bacterium]|nr:hypothetical protein [Deltaproteobacteria bacterium]MBI5902375.1 hypothetical protein [Deltaproteobacteria bacterium]